MTRIKALFTLVTLPLYLPMAIVKTIITEQKRPAAVEAGSYAKLDAGSYAKLDAGSYAKLDAAWDAYVTADWADADAAWDAAKTAFDAYEDELEKIQEENTMKNIITTGAQDA